MKHFIAPVFVALATAGFSPSGMAQTDHTGHGVAQAPKATEVPLTVGTVKKIDKTNKKVTLTHGPLPNGMPGMTMAFKVKDAAWLDKMKEGQKIRFAADEINGALTVVRFEPAQ